MDPAAPADSSLHALEQRLLEAARHDHIPDALGARMAQGLGVQAAGAALESGAHASSHASVSAGKLSAPLFAKPGLWGALALAGAIGVAGFQLSRPADGASHGTTAPRASSAPTAAVQVAATATASAKAPEVVRADAEPRPEPVPAQPTAAEAVRPAPTAARPLARPDDSALHAEVTLLDRARNALRAGGSGLALRLLDQHRQRFAHPTLAPEAAALRIEALVQRGADQQADALSQRFAASYPTHPLRARVDALRARGVPAASSAPALAP